MEMNKFRESGSQRHEDITQLVTMLSGEMWLEFCPAFLVRVRRGGWLGSYHGGGFTSQVPGMEEQRGAWRAFFPPPSSDYLGRTLSPSPSCLPVAIFSKPCTTHSLNPIIIPVDLWALCLRGDEPKDKITLTPTYVHQNASKLEKSFSSSLG